MRVLIVSPYPVLPPVHGGRVRTYRLAEALAAAGAAVDLVGPWSPGAPLRHREERLTTSAAFAAADVLPVVLGDRLVSPLVALSWPRRRVPRRRLRRFAGYDIVQFEFCAHAAWMPRVRRAGPRVVYSAHNVEQDFYRYRARGLPWGEAVLRRLRALEAQATRASDHVVACTELDAGRLTDLYGGAPVSVIPNGYPAELAVLDRDRLRAAARRRLGLRDGERALLFVGGPGHHNREAVEFLEHEVLPRLDAETRLVLVGKCATPRRRASGSVIRLGYQPDLRPALAAADVAVNPVFHGSGSSLKVIEALASGVPTVTTALGARGLNGTPLLRVAEGEDFPAAVVEHSAAPRNGHAAPDALAWSRLGRRLHALYEELLGG